MKSLKNLFGAAMVILLIMACKNESQPEVKEIAVETETTENKLDPNAKYAIAEFTIDGMTCEMGCAKTIEKKLAGMEGVKTAKVDFDKRLAMVEFDEAKVTTASLEETVTKVGDVYKVKDMKTHDGEQAKKECDPNCEKACCKGKTEAEKKACAENCEKACCASKA